MFELEAKKTKKNSLNLGLFLIAFLLINAAIQIPHGGFSSSQTPTNSDWPSPGYDLQNSNFDPQTVINSNNVNQLQLSWIYQVPENPYNIPGTAKSLGIETTPLVIKGIVYFATPYNDIIALNGKTGTTVWTYQVNMSKFPTESWWAPAYNERSLTYSNGTIYFMASDTSIYGLDALRGNVIFSLPDIGKDITGNNGQVLWRVVATDIQQYDDYPGFYH